MSRLPNEQPIPFQPGANHNCRTISHSTNKKPAQLLNCDSSSVPSVEQLCASTCIIGSTVCKSVLTRFTLTTMTWRAFLLSAGLLHIRFCTGSDYEPDICRLPKESGPCEGADRRWAFENGGCVEFLYGGCEGNGNNFGSKSACESACPDLCSLPLERGGCGIDTPSWGFENGRCKYFTYGGCGGNKNRFSSYEECHQACKHRRDKCYDSADAGDSCGSAKRLRRWIFDDESGKCILVMRCGRRGRPLPGYCTERVCNKNCGQQR